MCGGLKTSTIERLRGRWEVLAVSLPWNINRIGLAPISGKILAFGGEVIGQGYSVASWEVDVKEGRVVATKSCPVQGLFYGQGAFVQGSAVGFAGGVVVVYHEAYKTWSLG